MNLIVETDIGHDPDDFFAISYLIAAGVNIRCILISPGDPDQIAIAKLLCKECGLDIPIGISHKDRTKNSSGSIHHELLKKYKLPLEAKADGMGTDILKDVTRNYPDSELFIIGPVASIGKFIGENNAEFSRATMQGGFLPYSLHTPKTINEDFVGKESKPTFNLNGDRPNGVNFLNGKIAHRQLVGKNVCHTVFFSKEMFEKRGVVVNSHRAYSLFNEAATMYFDRHEFKKFHDPTAAVCHLHPEIGTWFRGNTIKMKDGWTTVANPEGDHILADIDYDLLWEYLWSGK